jgi:hypothetical protein
VLARSAREAAESIEGILFAMNDVTIMRNRVDREYLFAGIVIPAVNVLCVAASPQGSRNDSDALSPAKTGIVET